MSVDVVVDFTGLEKLRLRVEGMRERAADLSPVLNRQAQTLAGVIDGAFKESKSPNGKAWAKLSDVTAGRRRKGSSKQLLDTGQLKLATFAIGGKGAITFGVGGVPAAFARVHQFGNPKNRMYNHPPGAKAPIPARPFLPLDSSGDGDFKAGAAKVWRERTLKRVAAYVLHNEGAA